MSVSAYILIQTEVGKAATVAEQVRAVEGISAADDVTGPYDVIARAEAEMAKILEVDADAWRAEVPQIEAHFDLIGTQLPAELRDELNQLEKRLAN